MSKERNVSSGAQPSLELFSRKSSGLVRELSIADAAWYGILAAGALFGLLYLFPIPQAFLPGLSVPVATLIAMVLMPAVFAVYAGFASAMPRMGGDYLFVSRGLHPVLGFAFTFAWEVFMWVTFTTTGGLVIASLGLQPLLFNLGLRLDIKRLMDAANWIGSANGILVVTLAVTVAAFLTTIFGITFYRKIQRWILVPTVVLSGIVLNFLLLRSNDSFVVAFNAWYKDVLGVSNYAAEVERLAAKGGFVDPGFSWRNTLLALSITGFTWYVVYAAQGLLGEIKQAGNLKRLYRAFLFAGLFLGLFFWLLPSILFERAMGREFMHAYAFAWNRGSIEAPAGATYPAFAMMMTSNPIVLIALSLGFITVGYYFAVCVFLNMTRVLSAMGMDRSLPAWFADVHERYHAPMKAALFFGCMAVGMNILFRYNREVQVAVVLGGAFTSVGMIGIAGLAATFFPWRAKGIHDVAPIAQYRVLGLPAISAAGIITFLGGGVVSVMNLIFPELGFTTGWARAFLVFSVIASAIWFYAYRAYLRSRYSINIDLAFGHVPPE